MSRISINRRQFNALEQQFQSKASAAVTVFQEWGSVQVSFDSPPAAAGSPMLSTIVKAKDLVTLKQAMPAGDEAEVYVPCVENLVPM